VRSEEQLKGKYLLFGLVWLATPSLVQANIYYLVGKTFILLGSHSLDVQFILRPSGRGLCHQEGLYLDLHLHLYISILCEVEGSL